MLSLAAQAPSGGDLQPWRFVVVRDPLNREHLGHAAGGQSAIVEAPVTIVAFGCRDTWHEHAEEVLEEAAECGLILPGELHSRRREVVESVSRFPIEVWLNRHVAIAFTYLMISAEAMGWDTVPIERFDGAAVGKALGLPDDAEVVAMLAIGRQRASALPYVRRLAMERLVFAERFGIRWSETPDAVTAL